jgi:hypothetical protein
MFLTSLELEARKKAKTPQNYEFELSLKVGYLYERDCITRWIWLLTTCMVGFRLNRGRGNFLNFLGVPMIYTVM